MAERRQERVAHLLQAELARLLLHEVRDPRLRDVTVTGARVTPDLRSARLYVRTLAGPEAAAPTLAALAKATPFLRTQVARALGLRVVPELRFEYDTLPDRARRVEELLSGTPPGGKERE
jgi:ribosome-binding factor A